MADEQYKWLTRETAERLLRGESLEAVDAAARARAERLAKTLGALSTDGAPARTELRGEEGALVAFRKAREAAAGERAAAVGHSGGAAAAPPAAPARPSDAGLVRLGRPRRTAHRSRGARPVRLALTAALATCMVGGVAVAAGTGVLPTPFNDDRPGPAASVSSAATPELPLVSPSPDGTRAGATGTRTPGGTPSGTPGGSSPDRAGQDPARGGADSRTGRTGTSWSGAPSACRDVRDGRALGLDRRRTLEGAAGGSARVWTYCKNVLASTSDTSGDQGQEQDGKSGGNGQDDHDEDGHSGGRGGGNDHHQDGGVASPVPSAFAPLLPRPSAGNQSPAPSPKPTSPSPAPSLSPSPTYSAL
ncbi:hypothetical protein [Streptomyces sp. NPDC001978]|uniref:hypothetical protein n=1 Tax=Streptomyces sp. NPDC001978 TaxID=3364627 RepID=UPI003673CBB5